MVGHGLLLVAEHLVLELQKAHLHCFVSIMPQIWRIMETKASTYPGNAKALCQSA
jgi:hypothetical protein